MPEHRPSLDNLTPRIRPLPRFNGNPATFADRVNKWADEIERSLGLPPSEPEAGRAAHANPNSDSQ
jgi:hypothetical protein